MFMKMNHRYEIAIYINNICHIKHFFTFYKPLVKQNTTVTPKQINGKQKVSLKWGETLELKGITYIVRKSITVYMLILVQV